MYGLEAIIDARGLQMAVLGVTIVFSSLILLAIIISQLHNVLELWENRKNLFQEGPAPASPTTPVRDTAEAEGSRLPHPAICPDDIAAVADLWSPLVSRLGSPFALVDLYKEAAASDFPHPHLTICRLRDAGILVPAENSRFTWKQA